MSIIHDGIPELAPDPTRTEAKPRPSQLTGGRVLVRVMTLLMLRLWPTLAALTLGCVAAIAILSIALHSEFPLFSEASAARGRDCAAIRSARHALDRELDVHLATVGAHPLEAGQGLQDAVASFHAATRDIETASVAAALAGVDRRLDALTSVVRDPGIGGAGGAGRTAGAATAASRADQQVHVAWQGAIARVCS